MGALMRQVDWGNTPLGPPERWPQSLRTAVSIVLECKFGMMIAWGTELIQFYNDPFRPILGATKHPALGRGVRDTFSEAWHIIGPLFAQVLAGQAVGFEDMLVPLDRNGYLEECYFHYCYSPIRHESGEVGGILVTVSETTARVLAERRLRTLRDLASRAGQPQEEAEAWTGAGEVLAKNPADVPFALLYLVDQDGKAATLVSSQAAAVAFAPRSVSLQRDAAGTWPLAECAAAGEPLAVGDLDQRFGEIVGAAWPEPIARALLLPVTRPGLARPYGFLVTGINPRHELDGSYRDFFVLVADQISTAIANIRALAEERRRAEHLAALDRQKTAFFSSVSHEFRTPLTLMLAPLEDVRGKPAAVLGGAELEVVFRNSRRLLKLVNTLLDFSRIEAGRAEARFLPIDASLLTTALASSFDSLVRQAGLALHVNCPPLPQVAYLDPEMWEKIVLNLVSNAFKFTLQGSIAVSLEARGDSMVLSVLDTGTGIPEAELPHLFERFYRVDGAKGRSYEGSGIGLALVQELVKMHGGQIAVNSQLGVGSRFTVTLPLGCSHLPPERVGPTPLAMRPSAHSDAFVHEALAWSTDVQRREAEPMSASAGGPRLRRPGTILFADDNPDMRQYVRKLLVAEGWAVEVVDDGLAALERALLRVPDLILADVMMPRLDGFALLRALKEHDATRQVPVILLSARAGNEAAVEGIERGADDYIVKPFSAKELVSRVAARLEVSGARSAAARARERLQGQFMQAPVAVSVVTGPEFVYELANPLYLQLVGRESVVGKPIRQVFPELPPDAPVFQMLETVYATGEAFSATEYPLLLDRHGSGVLEEVYFKFTCQPVRDELGVVTEIMTVALDVTVETRARQRIEVLVEELKLADQRKDEFLATLAHELRNPMAAISTALSLLESSGSDTEKSARYRETARRQMSNLVRLVDDLLDVARITRGKVDLRKSRVDMAVVLQHALTAMHPLIAAHEHRLHVSMDAGRFDMQADATRLEQVIVNLLTNAAKYTPPGGEITVELRRERQGGAEQAALLVRDNGRGIPKAMLGKVFDLFTQVSPTIDRSTGGLGLGLTLCKHLTEMHGGTILASSDGPGHGSEFRLRLPLATVAAHEASAVAPRPTLLARTRRKILLVEDSSDARELLQECLESFGHEVQSAADGVEGIARLREFRPDVALVDIGLPGIDGFELARRFRALPEGASLFLAALTGYGGENVRRMTEDAGFDVHLIKPLELRALSEMLDRCDVARRR
jgi:signal transduction histidine kinase